MKKRHGGCGCLAVSALFVLLVSTCGRRGPEPITEPAAPVVVATPAPAGDTPEAKKARARYWIARNRAERRKRRQAEQRQAAQERREAARLKAEQAREDALTQAEARAGEQPAYTEAPLPAPGVTAFEPPQVPVGVNPELQRVRGYVRKDGTYVAPYVRTRANDTTEDNLRR